jgi:hypothetical protein
VPKAADAKVEYPGALFYVMSLANGKVERIIREELKRLRWTERELKLAAKSDPAKLALAARVRRETTLALGCLAARVHLGRRKSFSAKLHRWRRANEKGQ